MDPGYVNEHMHVFISVFILFRQSSAFVFMESVIMKNEGCSKGCVSGEVFVSVPADAECKLLSAGFDLVLSLHVGHELRAVAVDSQDGVAWTQVTLSSLTGRCYLEITFTHTKKKKRKSCY